MKRTDNRYHSNKQLQKMLTSIAAFITSNPNKTLSNQANTPTSEKNTSEIIEKKHNERNEGIKWTEKWGFWATVGMLLFTAFLFWQTKKQTGNSADAIAAANTANELTERTFNENRGRDSMNNIDQDRKDSIAQDNIDSSLGIAKINAIAAMKSSQIAEKALIETKKSYDFSRESAVKEIRAYISINSLNVFNLTIDSIARMEIGILNVGKTPAYRVKTAFGFIYDTSEASVTIRKFISQIDYVRENAPSWTLGAILNHIIDISHNKPFTKELIDLLKANKYQLYVIGSISYYDIFGNGHFTHLLAKYDFYKNIFHVCKIYNDAD